jgi:cytochrome c biogenesis protein CcdA
VINSLTLPVVVIAAFLDSFNPCAISVLLISLGFVASLGYIAKSIRKIGAAYVLGAYLGYLSIGLGVLKAITLFGTPNLFAKIAAFLFIVWGLVEFLKLKFPNLNIFKIPGFTHTYLARFMQKGSLFASFITGVLVSLFEFPCTGGPYFSILALLRGQATILSGLGYLLVYNLVFVLPLILIVVLASNKLLTEKINVWRKQNSKIFTVASGIIFIVLCVVLFMIV